MSASHDRIIWIPSRVPQSLPCSDCGRASHFIGFVEPEHYQYTCAACRATQSLTLAQINASEANRFHKLPTTAVTPIISSRLIASKQ